MTSHDDPKLTAYALGELDPAERAAFEAELDEAARQEIAEIEQLGALLSAGLTAEPLPALDAAQREAIEAAAQADAPTAEAAGAEPSPRTAKSPAPRTAKPPRHGAAADLRQPTGRVVPFPRWGYPLAGAAGILLAAGLGVTQLRGAREDATASMRGAGGRSADEPMLFRSERQAEGRGREALAQREQQNQDMHHSPQLPLPVGKGEPDGLGRPAARPQPQASPMPGQQPPQANGVPVTADRRLAEEERYRKAIEEYERRLNAEPEPGFVEPQGPAPVENPFVTIDVARDPESALSTFSIDVDTASYANVRSYLTRGALPPASAVRIEELVNYFDYDYAPPHDDRPFAAHVEVARCPWNDRSQLVRVGLQGRVVERAERPASNLVFLLDVSGSMNQPTKLPLLKQALELLVAQLDERDRVSIVVYAGASGLALPPTSGADRRAIFDAFARLRSGGSTNGGAGIELAYAIAQDQFIPGGVNRVILATDGDFNVGRTSRQDLQALIEQKAKGGVFLSVLGFGMSGHGDGTMETLADKGNGNYGYIDTLREAEKLLVDGLTGTLVTIAKDVKIQVDFNHHLVQSYRLVGYENRMLAAEDFLDDTKDAGEIGAGHTVTALYEVVLKGAGVIPSRYQDTPADPAPRTDAARDELLTVRLNYKQPDSDQGQGAAGILEVPLRNADVAFEQASTDFRFAAAVAAFGQILRDSQHRGSLRLADVAGIVDQSVGQDARGYRGEFRELVERARRITSDRR